MKKLKTWWFQKDHMDVDYNIYRCSNCRSEFSLFDGTPAENKYNHCPNCGKKMNSKLGEIPQEVNHE